RNVLSGEIRRCQNAAIAALLTRILFDAEILLEFGRGDFDHARSRPGLRLLGIIRERRGLRAPLPPATCAASQRRGHLPPRSLAARGGKATIFYLGRGV